MFLIGQYDAPFVRRTAIALRLFGLPFEHKPWSTFSDGEALLESSAILDYFDELVGPDRAMIARAGVERRKHLRITGESATVRRALCCAESPRRAL